MFTQIHFIALTSVLQKLYLGFRGFWILKVVQNSMASAMAPLRRSEAIVCFLDSVSLLIFKMILLLDSVSLLIFSSNDAAIND